MSRTGLLVVVALIFALAAAGVLVWTNVLDLSQPPTVERSTPAAPSATASAPASREVQLVKQMNDVAARGGYAATFAESGVKSWQLAAGHRLERFSLSDKAAVLARLTSSAPIATEGFAWETQGLSWLLPLEFNNRVSGSRIEIAVIARQSGANSADSISVLYATREWGNSGWKTLPLGADFELRSFQFDVPKAPAGSYTNQPILVITADPTGGGKSVELLGALVRPLPQPE